MTADEIRAAFLALPPRRKGRGRPRGSEVTFMQALQIERRWLELGGKRSHQTQAILEILEVRPRDPAKSKAHDRGKKLLKRNPGARVLARTQHQIAAMADSVDRFREVFKSLADESTSAEKFVRQISDDLAEIDRRLRNVPEGRRGPLMHMTTRDLIELLRANSIDGDFPVDVLEELERA